MNDSEAQSSKEYEVLHGCHVHELPSAAEPGTREWIKQGGHSFGSNPYDVLLEETRKITEDIEIQIRVIRWNIPK